MEIPMPKLTDTQLIILSAASQRDDRGVELPANLKGGSSTQGRGQADPRGAMMTMGR
jgi:hypothetical protein